MSWRYVLRRLIHGVIVVVGVALIVFFATHMLADPARKMLPLDASQEQYEDFRGRLGLDEPLTTQFVDFLRGMVTFDFGDSIWRQRPAADLVLERLPNTIVLAVSGLFVGILLSIPLGLLAALHPRSIVDRLASSLSLFGLALPQFWLGAVLILIFAVHLGALPTSGIGGLDHLILPALTVALPVFGKVTQVVRASVMEEMDRQYVVAAHAKGLDRSYILTHHVARNTALAISSFISLETARTLAGATVVVETVFAYPGIGYLAIQATQRDDLILLQAIVVVIALIVVISNLLFDFLYAAIDPRIRLSR